MRYENWIIPESVLCSADEAKRAEAAAVKRVLDKESAQFRRSLEVHLKLMTKRMMAGGHRQGGEV